MKNNSINNSNSNRKASQPRAQGNKPRPENKDDLDSREGEENLFKGDDVTHNKKETKKEHLKEKK